MNEARRGCTGPVLASGRVVDGRGRCGGGLKGVETLSGLLNAKRVETQGSATRAVFCRKNASPNRKTVSHKQRRRRRERGSLRRPGRITSRRKVPTRSWERRLGKGRETGHRQRRSRGTVPLAPKKRRVGSRFCAHRVGRDEVSREKVRSSARKVRRSRYSGEGMRDPKPYPLMFSW